MTTILNQNENHCQETFQGLVVARPPMVSAAALALVPGYVEFGRSENNASSCVAFQQIRRG